MANYDPAMVHVIAADEASASNGLLTKHGRILVHKVTLNKDASNPVSALIYDAATATGTALIALSGEAAENYEEANFDPPVPFETGLSTDLTGNGGTIRVYYTAA